MKALLLVGGKSSRMGSDKASLRWSNGESTLQCLVDVITKLKIELYLSVSDSQMNGDFNYPVIVDAKPSQGPLHALSSAIKHWNEPILLIACDLLLLDFNTIHSLIQGHDHSKLATCYANRLDHRVEPLCAIYQPECQTMLNSAIQHQKLCARKFLMSLDPKILKLNNPVALDNINTPYDWLEAKQKHALGSRSVTVKICYYAAMREKRGCHEEIYSTFARTAIGLYMELDYLHRFPIDPSMIRVAKNSVFVSWDTAVDENDEFVFMQPFSGG